MRSTVRFILAGSVAAAVLGAPASAAAKPPPPDTGAESNCARASTTRFDYAVPKYKPSNPGDVFHTESGTTTDEVTAYACMVRSGRTTTMLYGWSTTGRLHVAAFNFRLMDCAGNDTVAGTERAMTYSGGKPPSSGYAEATFRLAPGRALRPHVYGAGEYSRASAGSPFEGNVGRFDTWTDPKFLADGVCQKA